MATMKMAAKSGKKLGGKPMPKGMPKAEAKIEAAENRLAKKLPPGDRKKFAAVQKREMKMEGKEK